MLTSVLLLLAMVTLNQAVQGQGRPKMADSSVAAIMGLVRSGGSNALSDPNIVRLLRQDGASQSIAKLDELADSLTARVLRSASGARPGDDSFDRIFGVIALANAGSERGAGTPYAGALDRLIRINETMGRCQGTGSLLEMLKVASRARALAYVRSVAASCDETSGKGSSVFAVQALIDRTLDRGIPPAEREEVRAVLRDLFLADVVKGEYGRSAIGSFANAQGWKRPPPRGSL